MTRVPFTYTWIEPGKVMAGSIPQTLSDLDTLAAAGIKSILSLTRRDIGTYPGFIDWLNAHSFLWRQQAIPDGGTTDDLQMFSAVSYLADNVSMGRPVYVHCRGGIGRTGTILLAYYVLERGLTLHEAKEIVKVRRNYEGNASAIDQGSPQREWIDKLEDKRGIYRELFPNRKESDAMTDLEQIITRLGVHPLLGDAGENWWIEQNAHELATFLEAIQPIETVLELGTGFRAGLARFLTEVMGFEVTSIDDKIPQTPAPMARFIHANTHDAYKHIAFDKFDLIIIDADHAYEAVEYDYSVYAPLAKKVVALHDIVGLRDCEGVAQFWREIAYTKGGKLCKGYYEAIAEDEQRAGIGWHYVTGGAE